MALAQPALSGRWCAVDPLKHEYYYHSSYLFAAANPIKYVDLDGKRYRVIADHNARTVTFVAKIYTIDEESFNEAYDVAETLKHFTGSITQNGIKYAVKFQIAVFAPPEADILESKLGVNLRYKRGRQRVKKGKYKEAAQQWWIPFLKQDESSNIYLGETAPSAELKKSILDYGRSLKLKQEDLKVIQDRLNNVDKSHASIGDPSMVAPNNTIEVSRGTTYLGLAVQMRPMKSGLSEAGKYNLRLHEFFHLFGLDDVDQGRSIMNYDFILAENKRAGRTQKVKPQNEDIKSLINNAILRANPKLGNNLSIDVTEIPYKSWQYWKKSFERFRDWAFII